MSEAYVPAVAISGLGMASCFGGVVASCAAIRAGLSGKREIDMSIPNPGEIDPQIVEACPVRYVSGMEDYGRLVALLLPALKEALGIAQLTSAEIESAQLIILIPGASERLALDQISNRATEFPHGEFEFITERLSLLASIHINPENIEIVECAHSGFGKQLTLISAEIQNNQAARYIVCAVDSGIEAANIEGLMENNRLKTATRPNGQIPGEGASVVIIESVTAMQRRNKIPLACIGPSVYAAGPDNNQAEETIGSDEETTVESIQSEVAASQNGTFTEGTEDLQSNNSISHCIEQVIDNGGVELNELGELITDFNGEVTRAKAWANSFVNVDRKYQSIRGLRTWYPAQSVGDVGAATGAFYTCFAVRAFHRNFAKGKYVLIINSADDGSSTAYCISRYES